LLIFKDLKIVLKTKREMQENHSEFIRVGQKLYLSNFPER
jgi:hypothetical protein